MALGTVAGTAISISAATPATFDGTGYSALTWTVIGNIDDGGEHGREYAEVTFNPIDTRGTRKYKGSFNEGTKTLSIGYDSDDAGMIVLKTAVLSDSDFSFKVSYPGGDVDYFQAKTLSLKKATGGVDTMKMATVSLSITTNTAGVGIVEVLAV
jgi:archaellin